MKPNISQDQLTELKYKLTNKLVQEGIVEDCTDTDNEFEIDTENALEEVLTDFFELNK